MSDVTPMLKLSKMNYGSLLVGFKNLGISFAFRHDLDHRPLETYSYVTIVEYGLSVTAARYSGFDAKTLLQSGKFCAVNSVAHFLSMVRTNNSYRSIRGIQIP